VDNGVAFPHPANGIATLSGDGDTTFTFLSSNIQDSLSNIVALSGIAVTLKEEEISGRDLYNVGFSLVNGDIMTKNEFDYKISTTDTAGLNSAAVGSIISGSPNGTNLVTKNIYSSWDSTNGFSGLLASLTSNDGKDIGFVSFPKEQTIYVQDIIGTNSQISSIDDAHNQFTTTPEPMTLVMLGIGLVAFGYSRRNTLSASKGLSA
jgi:hypothetical protein